MKQQESENKNRKTHWWRCNSSKLF